MATPPAEEQGRAIPGEQPVNTLSNENVKQEIEEPSEQSARNFKKDGDAILTPKDWVNDFKVIKNADDPSSIKYAPSPPT